MCKRVGWEKVERVRVREGQVRERDEGDKGGEG